jgi:hypothetical protein
MSGPTRWRDDDSSPAEVRDLLRTVKGGGSRPIPAASRARSVARLDRMLALPAAAGLLLWLKGVAVAAGIGALGVVAVKGIPVLLSDTDAAPTVTAVATAKASATTRPKSTPAPTGVPIPGATAAPTATASVTVVPLATTATAVAVAPSPPIEPAPSTATDSLAREAAMLDRARAQLGSDPGAALATLDAQAVAFPSGHMGLERELLSVEALRRLHRVSEARARGESLLQRARGTIYEDRVRAILDALPP